MPSRVEVVQTANGFQLLRDGQPYFIRGAGGDGSKSALHAAGGNSWRTWGADDLDAQLAEADALGMTVTAGFWLGHKSQGFDYSNLEAVAAQKEAARQAILRGKASPALLMWAVGNEMENGDEDNLAMWAAVEDIAKMVHELDPHHPAMTVIAELGQAKVERVQTLCPSVDIIGLNTYGSGATLAERYIAAGGVKPYVVTEFGPAGTWESEKNTWGYVPEPTSTEKAEQYRNTYEGSVLGQPLCLGSYAFIWGHKQEATATWFGLLLPDGSRLGAVDALSQLWTGQPPVHPAPIIHRLTAEGLLQAPPGGTVTAQLEASAPDGDRLTVQWVLQGETKVFGSGGSFEEAPPTYPDAVVTASRSSALVRMPKEIGAYRLFAYVRNAHGGAATANLSLHAGAAEI